MAKILNLDKLQKTSDRKLKINGVDYAIEPMSVENFIETTRTVERLVKEGATVADQIEATVDMICRSVPTAPRDALKKYQLDTLDTIATFVRGEDVEEQEAAAAEEAGK
jgi:hypothetical protein